MNAPSRPFRLALAQMVVVGGDRDRNLAHALRQIELAAQGGAEVVLLPEALDLGWTHPSSRQWAEPIPDGQRCQAIRGAARLHRIHVCAGLTERAGERVYNAAVLVSPAGEVILHHRKLNELAIAHDVYDQGDRLGVVATPLGTFGLMICADGFARGHVVARTLGLMGADVILSPSAWAVPPDYDPVKRPYGLDWQENYATVAREFRLWVAGCSNVGRIDGGPWHGHDCIGCSCVVNPDGRTVAVAPYGAAAETILFTEVKPEPRPRAW